MWATLTLRSHSRSFWRAKQFVGVGRSLSPLWRHQYGDGEQWDGIWAHIFQRLHGKRMIAWHEHVHVWSFLLEVHVHTLVFSTVCRINKWGWLLFDYCFTVTLICHMTSCQCQLTLHQHRHTQEHAPAMHKNIAGPSSERKMDDKTETKTCRWLQSASLSL